jgi:hypothetical protein
MKTHTLSAMLICLFTGLGLLQPAQAVSPPPDGAYTGANTAEGGSGALFSLTTGSNNTAIGSQTLFSLTTGNQNTAVGAQALKSNLSNNNTAIGFQALVKNTVASDNTAVGWRALFNNTASGSGNAATGSQALYNNITGFNNTADGFQALFNNTDGPDLTNGNDNTATGWRALFGNVIGVNNTADGVQALYSNGFGDDNTAVGINALFHNTIGSSNIAIGSNAGINLTDGDNNIDIGNDGVAGDFETIRIGETALFQTRTFIAGIRGVTTGNTDAIPVVIDSTGQLGTMSSSQRFKKEIKPMDSASKAILALKPVTFHYKSDVTNTPQFGLVAEEVAEVNPDLVVRDKNGRIYTVRYDAVNAMLLNEFLKEHRKVENLKNDFDATVVQQQKEIAALTAIVKQQAAQIQKVSAQLEMGKAGPQTVLNNQ